MTDEDIVFAVFMYRYDDKARKFVVADDPVSPGKQYYRIFTSPDAVLNNARYMISMTLIQEYGETDNAVKLMDAEAEAEKSIGAMLIRLPRSADIDGGVGFLMGRFDAKPDDRDNFAYARALAVRARNDSFVMKYLPEALLSAVNNPEEI